VTAVVIPAPTLTQDLRGFWSFVHGVPTTAGRVQHADLSGHGHTATAVNGPASVEGPIGTALRFDGTNDYVYLGNPADLNFTGAITLSAWIKPEATNGLAQHPRPRPRHFACGRSLPAHQQRQLPSG
jgi:hypothetical protein